MLHLDREELCAELEILLAESDVRAGLAVVVRESHFVADFVAGVRGARRGVGVVTDLLHDPSVRRANGLRLARRHRSSPLNLHLTTRFGHEVAVILLLRAIADATAVAPIRGPLRARRARLLGSLLAEAKAHPGVLHRHQALLAHRRAGLQAETREALEYLDMLNAADYEFSACLAAVQAASALAACAEPPRVARSPERLEAVPVRPLFAVGRAFAPSASSRPH